MRRAFVVLAGALRDHARDGMPLHAAALAFYLLLATVPLFALVILAAGAGAREWLFSGTDALLGDQHGEALKTLMDTGSSTATGWRAAGVALLFLFAATRVFAILEISLNKIWDVKAKPERGLLRIARKRLVSIGALTGLVLLLVVSLAAGGILAAILPAWTAARVALGALLGFAALAFVYKQAPDAHTRWRDVLPAAASMALLLAIGERVLGTAFARTLVLSTYGSLAGVIVALLWFYFTANVLLFGAELTQESAASRGERPRPEPIAEARGEKDAGPEGTRPEGAEPTGRTRPRRSSDDAPRRAASRRAERGRGPSG